MQEREKEQEKEQEKEGVNDMWMQGSGIELQGLEAKQEPQEADQKT